MNVPILAKAGRLPINYEFTPANYRPLFLQRVKLYLSGDNILLGSTEASEPTRNIGGWFTDGTWRAWDDETGRYLPVDIGFISGNFGMTINAAPTANRTLTLPNKSGTAATLADILVPRVTIVLTGTAPTIDASSSDDFYLELSGNTTFPAISNMPAGGKIKISLVNVGTSYTVTWPSAGANEIKWPGGVSPTQPTAAAGQRALGVYTIRECNVGITPHLWGEAEITGFDAPATVDTGATNPPGAYYGGGDVPPPKSTRPYDRP